MNNQITKTQMISFYDQCVKTDHELTGISYYLADMTTKQINEWLDRNPQNAVIIRANIR